MDLPASLSENARKLMVDGQIRPNKVYDPRLLAALRRLPRERFLPPHLAPLAYVDEDVDLGHGRCLLEPMVIARLLQAAAIRDGERALVVASGSGYGAALLSACGAQVTALEEDAALLALAREALPALAPEVTLIEGELIAGHPAGAPYDLILIEGAVEEFPPVIVAQLAPHGRLIAIRSMPRPSGIGRICQAVIGERVAGRLSLQPLFDCAAPVLPAMRRIAGFVF